MENIRLIICIPTHGWTVALEKTLIALKEYQDSRVKNSHLIISNSGLDFKNEIIWNGKKTIIKLKNEDYWTNSVAALYQESNKYEYTHLLLMNHDCMPKKPCLIKLLDYVEKNENVILHSVLAYQDRPYTIWWAGNNKIVNYLYRNKPLSKLPKRPYKIASAMGQCLLIPKDAVNNDYLHKDLFPHYFGDTVQTSCMRRAGFPLYIIPDAIAYVDLSDFKQKRERVNGKTWQGLFNALFKTYSHRNIKALFFSQIYQRDFLPLGIFYGISMVVVRIGETLLEKMGFMKRKK